MTGALAEDPIKEHLAAVSVGILPDGYCVLDLDYAEDSNAAVDMNIVMTESGEWKFKERVKKLPSQEMS